ncbi:MAG: ATP synthase F1 subunit epsilon [Oscillospiraceae bacterium]|nr:ATP synthase F1 subunit epsilon [Oscillospiraceae bacterium]
MRTFPLKIVTPYGNVFDGEVEELVVRTVTGDMGILAGHVSCIAPLGMGRATVVIDGEKRYAACIGGMVSVVNGHATLVPTTFEWAEDIDAERAEASERRAKQVLADQTASDTDLRLAQARLRRALVRKGIANSK